MDVSDEKAIGSGALCIYVRVREERTNKRIIKISERDSRVRICMRGAIYIL